ncbi:uncharacterized protein [Phaseolus vulgaris]|uniref:uncharacterized protein n=1 Tax=Phaseolus vulgaris TaxID=3885 RepID=UPI0035CC9255
MSLPPQVEKLLSEFEDIFSNEGPIGLPPIRGIEHQIDFIPGASLPNRPAYRTNPEETKEIESQVQDLLEKGTNDDEDELDLRTNPFQGGGDDGGGPSSPHYGRQDPSLDRLEPCGERLDPNNMLGQGKLAKLRALARTHGLASGSQTVPNSVVEIAVAQGRPPPKGPTPPDVQPAAQRKKLVLRKPKRKAPQIVHEEEEESDEATEDGLVTKRKRVALSSPPAPPPLPTSTSPSTPAPPPSLPPPPASASPVQAIPLASAPPAVEAPEPNFMEDPPSASTPCATVGGGPPSNASAANVAPMGDEVAHDSPILITESLTSPPRQEAPADQPTKEGGGESQQQAQPAPPHAAAREQFACLFPDLDLSMVSLNNEVVDGKVVPAED